MLILKEEQRCFRIQRNSTIKSMVIYLCVNNKFLRDTYKDLNHNAVFG
jgi:hypothetical protein